MCFTKSRFSRWQTIARSAWWRRMVKPVGYAIGYPAWLVVQVAWFLMFGTWAHVTWQDNETGREMEFRPLEPKADKLFPPLHYVGEVGEVE